MMQQKRNIYIIYYYLLTGYPDRGVYTDMIYNTYTRIRLSVALSGTMSMTCRVKQSYILSGPCAVCCVCCGCGGSCGLCVTLYYVPSVNVLQCDTADVLQLQLK